MDTVVASLLSDQQRTLLLPAGLEPNTRFTDYHDVGWFKSIAWDARVTGLLPKIVSTSISPASPILGDSVTLSIQATGAWGYRWYKNRQPLMADGQLVTGASYTINSASSADAGAYVVEVENIGGYKIFSDEIEVGVYPVGGGPASPVISAVTPHVLSPVPLGVQQSLTIAGSGFTQNSTLLFNDGFNTYPAIVPIYVSANELRYDVSVGPTQATWTVRVVDGISTSAAFPFYVSNAATACVDSNEPNDSSGQATVLQLGVPAVGLVCHGGDFDWFRIDVAEPGSLTLGLTVPQGNDYDLEFFGPSGAWLAGSYHGAGASETVSWDAVSIGTYRVRVYGHPAGHGSFNATESYSLLASAASGAIVIVNDPTDRTVSVGSSAIFSVTATGAPPLVYQWRRNGVAIPFSFGPSYATPPTSLGDDGAQYSVEVSNQFGSKVSNTATLSVNSASSMTWTGAGGDGNWFNSTNWSSFDVPSAGDVVSVSSGTVNVPAGVDVAGVNLEGGVLTGDLAVDGTLNWTGGVLNARVTVMPGAVVNISGDGGKQVWEGFELINYGTVLWSGTGEIRGLTQYWYGPSGPVYLRNRPGGIFSILGDATVAAGCPGGCAATLPTVVNEGLVVKNGGTGTTTFPFGFTNTTTGLIQVNAGTLAVNGLTNDGLVQVNAGAALMVQSGEGAGVFQTGAAGKLSLSNFTVSAGGAFQGPGTVVLGGNLTGPLAGTFVLDASHILAGDVTLTGTLNWTGGVLNARVTVMPGAVVNISGDGGKQTWEGFELINYGTVLWSGTGEIRGLTQFWYGPSGPVYLRNRPGGVFSILGDAAVAAGCPGGCAATLPTVVNEGLVVKNGGTGTTTFPFGFTNTASGLIQVNAGTLVLGGLTNDGLLQINAGAAATVQSGGGAGMFQTAAGGQLSVSNFTVSPGGGFQGPGQVVLGGSLNGPLTGTFVLDASHILAGDVTLTGTLNWTGGVLNARVTVMPGAVVNISGDGGKQTWEGFELINYGTVLWSGTGEIRGVTQYWYGPGGPVYLRNRPGGVVTILGDAPVTAGCPGGCPGTLLTVVNEGLVVKNGGTGTTTFPFSFINTGTIQVNAGTLVFGALTNDGLVQVNAGAALMVQSGQGAGVFQTAAGGQLSLSNFTVSPGGGFQGSGTVVLGGNLNGPLAGTFTLDSNHTLTGDFTLIGTLNWTGGVMDARVTVMPGAVVNISGDNAKLVFLGFELINYGTVLWSGAGEIHGYTRYWYEASAPVYLRNRPGGVISILGDAAVGAGCPGGCAAALPTVVNEGLVVKNGGVGTTTFLFGFTNTNTGTIQVNAGTLVVSGLTNDGLVQVNAGAALMVQSGQGAGVFQTAAGGQLSLSNFTVSPGGGFQGSGTVVLGGNLNGPLAGTFTLDSNHILAGDVTLTGTLNWTGGVLNARVTVMPGAVVNISGDGGKQTWEGFELINYGTVLWSGTGEIRGVTQYWYGPGGPVYLRNRPGGVVSILGDAPVTAGCPGGCPGTLLVVENEGLVVKNGGAGTTTFPYSFINTGTIEVHTGTLYISSLTQTSGSTLLTGGSLSGNLTFTGGTLSGSGIINGAVINDGAIVSPGTSPGLITINGSYTQTSAGTLTVELAGLAPGTSFDKLSVNGPVTLAGTLQVNLSSGFVPAPGDAFGILAYSSRTGTFDNITTQLPLPLQAALQYDPALLSLNIGALAGAFAKISPISGGSSARTSATLTWSASAGATGYEYCVDTTNNDGCDGQWTQVAGTTTPLPGLSPNTAYYWQVRAISSGGTAYADGSPTAWWSFTTRGVLFDFTADGKSDILWRHATNGQVWLWPMNGAANLSENFVRTVPDTNWEIRGQGDQNGDGHADILWRNKLTGGIVFWPMIGSTPQSETFIATVDPSYDIVGTGDYNGDGKSDILWRHAATGQVWIWLMNGAATLNAVHVDTVDPLYRIDGSGDLNADGNADIVWRNTVTGDVWVWLMNGTTRLSQTMVGSVPDLGYQIIGIADHTGDGKSDILWRHTTQGHVWIWPMDGAVLVSQTFVGTVDPIYAIVGTGDYDGDGKADILWHHSTVGDVWVWLMDGATMLSQTLIGKVPDLGYQIVKVR
jgi:hypothetical protein